MKAQTLTFNYVLKALKMREYQILMKALNNEYLVIDILRESIKDENDDEEAKIWSIMDRKAERYFIQTNDPSEAFGSDTTEVRRNELLNKGPKGIAIEYYMGIPIDYEHCTDEEYKHKFAAFNAAKVLYNPEEMADNQFISIPDQYAEEETEDMNAMQTFIHKVWNGDEITPNDKGNYMVWTGGRDWDDVYEYFKKPHDESIHGPIDEYSDDEDDYRQCLEEGAANIIRQHELGYL